jgi:4a-hydroxytetrahydrobiopterin dehydratase
MNNNWREENNKLVREFVFDDFVQAFGFLTKIALVAEKMNHHPEIINSYNRVLLRLSTHDAGDVVTEKDRKLALKIDSMMQ